MLYPVHVPRLACILIISASFRVVVHGLGLFASQYKEAVILIDKYNMVLLTRVSV